jgi:16S rRNA (adenine1518-N6/adenine1519-N6)-dimethyltransferase
VNTRAEYNRDYRNTLLGQTKGMLRRLDLRARKSLGQHFLIDREVLERVASAAGLAANDTVIEVGPGLGVLTRELAVRAGRVVAVELDNRLASILNRTLAPFENVTIVNRDILKIEPAALLEETRGKSAGYEVVANLPYYITSAVIRHFLEARLRPRLMVVMVQKEVARAIVAEAGRMSLLSVSVQFYGRPEIVSYVAAGCFYPPPEVDSAILKINVYPRPLMAEEDASSFFELVRAGFSAPRKQLVNSLAQGLGLAKAEVLPLLERAGIMPRRRAESLNMEEWQRLWQVWKRGN